MAGFFSWLSYFWYRFRLCWTSLHFLWTLPKQTLTDFLDSYSLYDDEEDRKQCDTQERGRKLVHYYQVMNHLCSLGQVEKMYIPPWMKPDGGIHENQIIFEKQMIQDLNLNSGHSKVLDIGCGRGLIMSHVAKSYPFCSVYGMNIDKSQIAYGQEISKVQNLACQFYESDFNKLPLPFADGTFDAIYQVQAFSLAEDLPALMKEIHRILKPGGRLACLDWIKLPAYDSKNEMHRALMKKVKPLIGAIGTWSEEEYLAAIKPCFNLVYHGNLSIKNSQAPLIRQADTHFTKLTKLLRSGIKLGIIPQHIQTLFDRLVDGGEAFIQADEMGLVTTSFYVVAEKPFLCID